MDFPDGSTRQKLPLLLVGERLLDTLLIPVSYTHLLSGFTAKLAGTERGITEPTPTFSACFGQAFLELHPTKYAEELCIRDSLCARRCSSSTSRPV